jgi:hypothetical protein
MDVATMSATRFPEQSGNVGRAVLVWFSHDAAQILPGTVRREDLEPPFETLLELADGRLLRGAECLYMFATKPKCKLSGTDGNIFALGARASRALRTAGQAAEAKEMQRRIIESRSYDEALAVIAEYVEIS